MARESAFFALFLTSELGHFTNEKRDFEGWLFSLLCLCIMEYHTKTAERCHYPLFFFSGSPSPTGENKDKFGRLRSLCHNRIIALRASGQIKLRFINGSCFNFYWRCVFGISNLVIGIVKKGHQYVRRECKKTDSVPGFF